MTTPEPMPLWKALQLADHVSPTPTEAHAALMALRAQVAAAHGRTADELASAAHSPAPAAAVAALLQAAP